MKKTALGLSLIFSLLFSAASVLLLVNSALGIVPRSTMPAVVINSDGSVTGREWNPQYREFEVPYAEFINRTGNVYTLTADIDGYALIIERSNIVFDGAGHTVHTPPPETGTVHSNAGLTLSEVTHVIVKNLELSGVTLTRGVDLYYSYNCVLTGVSIFNIHYSDLTETVSQTRILGDSNTVTESNIRLNVDGNSNLFSENNVHELDVYGSNNRFYKNNFFLTDIPAILSDNFWDNGSVGNYWSNYSIKYPNASEIGNTGIGDTTHTIERAVLPGLNDPNAINVDNYPLMYPWGAPGVALLGMQNVTYYGGCFLNFTVSKPVVWLDYSLDGQDNVTVSGNVTLGELSGGSHNVTVYAKDAFGYVGASETARFTVTELFPFVPVVAASGVAVIFVGMLVYFKKRKHRVESLKV